ncbi:hypothetical protein Drorol1_Dr00000040 [Drosera rotundifolia]
MNASWSECGHKMLRQGQPRYFQRCSLGYLNPAPPNHQLEPPSLSLPARIGNGLDTDQPSTPNSSNEVSELPPESSASSAIITDETGNPNAQFKLDRNGLCGGMQLGAIIMVHIHAGRVFPPSRDGDMIWEHFRRIQLHLHDVPIRGD